MYLNYKTIYKISLFCMCDGFFVKTNFSHKIQASSLDTSNLIGGET